MNSFTKRVADALGRPVDAAASVRSGSALWFISGGAAFGAALGSISGGSVILAGVGGGLGSLVGIGVAALVTRRADPKLPVFGVLSVEPDQVTIHRSGSMRPGPAGEVMAISYADMQSASEKSGMLSVSCEIELVDGRRIKLDAGKAGVGAGGEAFRLLAERAGSVRPSA